MKQEKLFLTLSVVRKFYKKRWGKWYTNKHFEANIKGYEEMFLTLITTSSEYSEWEDR